jgi:hypothetical protein
MADLGNQAENELRKAILGAYRGFPNRGLVTYFPPDAEWSRVALSADEIRGLRYVRRDYRFRCCEHTFVTSQGSAFMRFRRALDRGNATEALLAAGELQFVGLAEALELCPLIRPGALPTSSAAGTGASVGKST